MSSSGFASTGDLQAKKISFSEVGSGLYAFTAEGDPNSGIIVGDDSCLVMDAQATPGLASLVVERVRQVTDRPINYVCCRTITRCASSAPQPTKHKRSSPRRRRDVSLRSAANRIGIRNMAAFPGCSLMPN